MNSQFHIIDKSTWERSVYFDYYYNRIKCKYNLNANLDITRLVAAQKAKGLRFFPVMLYVIMKAVNRNKEFRMSFDEDGRLGYWDEVVPSYTLFHPETKTFTDIWSEYSEDHRGVPERDGRHQGTPRTTRQLLPRVVPAVAELHRLRARHVH